MESCGDGQGPLPFRDLAAELLDLRRVAQDHRVAVVQRPEPGVVRGVELRLRQAISFSAGTCQVVDLGRQELPEDCLGRDGRRLGGS